MTRTLLLVVLVTAVAASAAGQEPRYRAPRTDGGHPDLQGMWNFNSRVPLQRPAAVAGKKVFTKDEAARHQAAMRNALAAVTTLIPVEAIGLDWMDTTTHAEDLRTSLITYPDNGRLPILINGVQRMPGVEDLLAFLGDTKGGPPPSLIALLGAFSGGKRESHKDFPPSARCLIGADVPFVPMLADNLVQIVQARDYVALVTDFDRRIIPLDGGPAVGDALRSWTGVSRGRWEGETLVVDTRNFDGRTPSFAGAGDSRDKVVTERFRRTSGNVIEYAATVVDPKTFQDRVELSFPMALVDARIHEGGCHEGNYSMRYALSAARQAEQAGSTR